MQIWNWAAHPWQVIYQCFSHLSLLQFVPVLPLSSCFAPSAASIQRNAAGFWQRQSLEGSCGPNGPMSSPTVHRENDDKWKKEENNKLCKLDAQEYNSWDRKHCKKEQQSCTQSWTERDRGKRWRAKDRRRNQRERQNRWRDFLFVIAIRIFE